jgi:hypothetical protein
LLWACRPGNAGVAGRRSRRERRRRRISSPPATRMPRCL